MPVIIDKLDLLRRIAKVRSWSRNGDMLAICDALEHMLLRVEPPIASRDTVLSDLRSRDTLALAKRRADDNARQKRRRAKRLADSVKAA